MKTWILLICIWVASVTVKYYTISGNDIYFFFDQARDANISRQIIEAKNLKIYGPTASGSEDKLFHGVLYYYLIGPLYTLSHGNPFFVSIVLGIINSLTIFPLFLLVKSFTKRGSLGITVALFSALAFESSQLSTWLSNPGPVVLTSTFFFYFLWQTFYNQKTRYLPLTMVFLGLSNQLFLFTIYLWIPLIGSAAYSYKRNTWTARQIFVGLACYFMVISSMVLVQGLQIYRGIGTVSENTVVGDQSFSISMGKFIAPIQSVYLNQLSLPIFPLLLPLSLLIFVISMVQIYKSKQNDHATYLSLILISPLFLLSIQPRTAPHTLIGFSSIVYLVIAFILKPFLSSKLGRMGIAIFIGVFIITNIFAIKMAKERNYHLVAVQKGGLLKDALKVIDETYQKSNGSQFSISTLTSPFQYNTTWAYLYDWYGKSKYGYVPSFLGPDQTGIFAGELLAATSSAEKNHFTITEKDIDLDSSFKKQFYQSQDSAAGSPSATIEFRGFTLQIRQPTDLE